MQLPTLSIERKFWQKGLTHIAGIDEVGRGCLAGPVVAAAVVFPEIKRIPAELRGVRDSKLLSPLQRERLYPYITNLCISWAVGVVSHRIIDQVSIANATYLAMQKAVGKMFLSPGHLLIDGRVPQNRNPLFAIPYSSFIHGDRRLFSIAAASIIAKVTRDRLMRRLHARYPRYGFHVHKGYGTAKHYAALKAHGPCPIHRRSFFLG